MKIGDNKKSNEVFGSKIVRHGKTKAKVEACVDHKDEKVCCCEEWQDLWRAALLEPRQRTEVNFSQNYLSKFNHGTATHTNLVLVAKLANVFDSLVGGTGAVQEQVLSAMNSEADRRCDCECSEDEEGLLQPSRKSTSNK